MWNALPPGRWIALAAIVGFLIGFGWQYASARSLASRLNSTTRELQHARLEAMLAVAVTEAQRDDYDRARQQASAFYTEAPSAPSRRRGRVPAGR